MASMVRLVPYLAGNGTVRRLRVSLPLVPGLVDGVRYALPESLPAPSGIELRPLSWPRLGQRGGTLRAVSSAAIREAPLSSRL